MLKNIALTIYVIIIGIAIGVVILSNHITNTGTIEFGSIALVQVESNVLEPEAVVGDLVVIDTTDTKVKEKDIVSYITLEEGESVIRTNAIAAITKDKDDKNIYSLKKEDGTIENIDDSCILGTYQSTIPFAGKVLGYILTQKGFFTVTLLPAVILFFGTLLNFLLNLKKM